MTSWTSTYCTILFTSLLTAASLHAAEPILLQGAVDPDPEAGAWYKSSDPEVLFNQIELLENTIREQRRSLEAAQDQLAKVKVQNKQLRKQLLKARNKSVEAEPVDSGAERALRAELDEARSRILILESERDEALEIAETLSAAQETAEADPTPVPVPAAADDEEVQELKALVRTYEKTIASLESELQDTLVELHQQTEPAAEEMPEAEPTPVLPEDVELEPIPAEEESEEAEPEEKITIEDVAPITELEPQPEAAPLPSSTEQVEIGNTLLLSGDIAEAEELFSQISENDPEYTRAQLGLATVYYSRDQILEAGLKVRDILAQNPLNPQAIGLHGIITWREGDFDKASTLLEQALELDPLDAQNHNYKAIILHSQGDYFAAERALKKAIELNPQHPEAHFNLAVLNMIGPLANPTKAQEYYDKAILLGSQRDPNFEASLYK